MEDLKHGLLPGRKADEEPELFTDETEIETEPTGPVDSDIVETPEVPIRKQTHCRIPGDGSFGSTLAELRMHHNYTIEQLAEETKIREMYLEALEAEDYKNLPQLVYVLGYIRKLCALYSISREDADELTADLRERLQYELPEDLNRHTADRERSEEDERRQRQLLLLIAGAITLIVLAVIAGAVLIVLALRSHNSNAAVGDPFNETLLVDLQPKPALRVQELK